VVGIGDVIEQASDYDTRLIPTLEGSRTSLSDALRGRSGSVLVMIGPEGDFTPDEVSQAISAGFVPITLGRNVLRVDTAALAVASYIMLSRGDGGLAVSRPE
jgi:16S rRNA (uracil1498-N3)-methyltransferase